MQDLVLFCGPNFASSIKQLLAEHDACCEIISDSEIFDLVQIENRILIAFLPMGQVPNTAIEHADRAYNFFPGPPSLPVPEPAAVGLENGKTEFGCVAHELAGRDFFGKILAVRRFGIPNGSQAADLRARTEIELFGLLEEVLPDLLHGTSCPLDQVWTEASIKPEIERVQVKLPRKSKWEKILSGLAPYDLGNALQFGLHIAKDPCGARAAYAKAADTLQPQALLRLARVEFHEGNRRQALIWALLAEQNGNKAAKGFIKVVQPTNDELRFANDISEGTVTYPF